MNAITKIVAPETVGARKIDTSRGESRGDLSAQWHTRPDDQRFTSLNDLLEATSARRDTSFEVLADVNKIRFEASRDDETRLAVITPDGRQVAPTHYAFGQICSLVRAPAPYLRSQHAFRAAFNLQNDVLSRGERLPLKLYGETSGMSMRAATGPDYGRIYDAELVAAVQKIAGNGTGDTHWKIPGCIDWKSSTYNPYVEITKESTTLYASDRDVFMFLVDDTRPIEIGKLANGDPDYIFRGFYAYNSEVGARSLGIATFWLRGICMNRMMWGVENFEHLRIVHSKHGALRFNRDAQPALEGYANSEPTKLLAGIKAAKEAVAARSDDDRKKVLSDLSFSLKMAETIIETHEREEGRKPETVFDFAMGITAVARTIQHQDKRLELELQATKFMNRAARHAA